jgi:hypothetical protein
LQAGLKLGAAAVAAAAIVKELRKPSGERQWNGRIGVVPYDFRLPTPQRLRERWWNPDDERILVPQVFGVGWSINFGRLVRVLRA